MGGWVGAVRMAGWCKQDPGSDEDSGSMAPVKLYANDIKGRQAGKQVREERGSKRQQAEDVVRTSQEPLGSSTTPFVCCQPCLADSLVCPCWSLDDQAWSAS